MKDVIELNCAGKTIEHRITRDDVAGFVSERFIRKNDQPHVKAQIKDALTVLEIAFGLNERVGYDELFGKNPGFKRYLLERMNVNGKPQDD